MAEEINGQPTTNAPPQTPVTDLPSGGGIVAGGGAVPATGGTAPLPAGGITLGVDNDVNAQLEAAKPAFGNTIAAVCSAIAESQKTLDQSLLDSINKLATTEIETLSQVEIEIGDDGQPTGNSTLVKNKVTALQLGMAVGHAWDYAHISLDVTAASFHAQQGLTFSAKQANTSVAGGISWNKSFGGWFSASHSQSQQKVDIRSESDAEWVSGQLLIDAQLGERTLAALPAPVEIAVGPQILVTQNEVEEEETNGAVTARKMKLDVQVRKASGAPNPNVAVTVDAPPTLLVSGGNAADAHGKLQLEVKRQVAAASTPYRQFALVFKLNDLKKPHAITL